MTHQHVQNDPLFNPNRAMTSCSVEVQQAHRSPVTLIYINMPESQVRYRQETAS